ncbi:unnamed protein product [Bathycoccus prasinos]
MAAMMLNQRTSGFVGTPTVSKSASRTTTRTTFTIESGLSTTDRNNKRSRIGKQPISVPKGVTYDLKEGSLKVKGPKGELSLEFPAEYISMKVEGEQIVVDRTSSTKKAREQHALYRTLANNMFVGVSTGFERKLKLVGVGYKAAMQGSKAVSLSLGKAHPDVCEFPAGVTVKVDSPTELTVSGYDKSAVGNFAAIIRSKRKPEPYKGEGYQIFGRSCHPKGRQKKVKKKKRKYLETCFFYTSVQLHLPTNYLGKLAHLTLLNFILYTLIIDIYKSTNATTTINSRAF